MPLNHDAAWFLYLAQRVVEGDVLYRDLFDLNPPLIVWLNLPIVWLARLMAWPESTVFHAAVLGLVTAVVLTLDRLLQLLTVQRRLIAGLGAAVVFVLLPGYDFGQREHVALVLIAPVVALGIRRQMATDDVRPGVVVAIAIAGALGALLKPHFVIPWVFLRLITTRRMEGEDVALAAMGVAYGLAILLVTPYYLGLVGILGPVYRNLYPMTTEEMLLSRQVACLLLGSLAIVLARGWSKNYASVVCDWGWLSRGGPPPGQGFPLSALSRSRMWQHGVGGCSPMQQTGPGPGGGCPHRVHDARPAPGGRNSQRPARNGPPAVAAGARPRHVHPDSVVFHARRLPACHRDWRRLDNGVPDGLGAESGGERLVQKPGDDGSGRGVRLR
ncbi:MAG TPA: hypothetical protein VIQ76_08800 [Propionibacteriaceae bacterium]|jgi:hypothetical protein